VSRPPFVGFVTIGQSPRDDVVPEMAGWIGSVEPVERGALDGMGAEEIASLRPDPQEYALVTRLRDGSAVTVAKRHLLPGIQAAVSELEGGGARAVVLLCTGEFPPFEHERPLLEAERLLVGGVRAIARGARVGVVCPLEEQEELTREKWRVLGSELRVAAASPYVGEFAEELRRAGREMGEAGVEYVVLDCMGYTQRMREVVREAAGAPVLLARSIVARLAAEVL
jgi:protein AroM